MNKETKQVVIIAAVGVALLHAVLLGSLLSAKGEGAAWALVFLEWPLFWLSFNLGLTSQSPEGPMFYAYLWIGGTLFYGLCVGGPLGLLLSRIIRWFRRA